MLELLKSLVFAVIMLIYGLGEVFNIFSGIGQKDQSRQNH
ncbi:MAG: AcrZ family multidrug efflux pump-associated protein [Citrobacter freundii]|nr:AcrZ family multidrug efflux pump-associated protein [Citrobacter freundii]